MGEKKPISACASIDVDKFDDDDDDDEKPRMNDGITFFRLLASFQSNKNITKKKKYER